MPMVGLTIIGSAYYCLAKSWLPTIGQCLAEYWYANGWFDDYRPMLSLSLSCQHQSGVLADTGARSAPRFARTPNWWSRINPNFEQTQTSNKPKLQTNPKFEQTQSSNKSKFRTNPKFEQIQISNEPKVRTDPNFKQTKKFLALGGFRIIRP